MVRLVALRLGGMVVVLFAATTAAFFLLHAASDNPVDTIAPAVAADPEARAAIEQRLGLDRPLFEQYVDYLGGLLRGDLGVSLYDGSSVSDQIGRRLPVSLELGLLAGAIGIVPGAALGIHAARRAGRPADTATRVVTVLALSIPAYWLAVVCLVVVGDALPAVLPDSGSFVRFSDDPLTNLQRMALPAVVLGLGTFAMVARSMRSGLVEAMSRDDVTFARAMGMPERSIVRRIALRNAVLPTLTVAGVLLGGLMAGSILVENVFQIPGLGQLLVTAFVRRDYPLALGATITTAAIFVLLNLVVDLVALALDPRTRSVAAPGLSP